MEGALWLSNCSGSPQPCTIAILDLHSKGSCKRLGTQSARRCCALALQRGTLTGKLEDATKGTKNEEIPTIKEYKMEYQDI